MLLSAASYDKENSPCLKKEYEQEIRTSDVVRVSTQKLRSIIKNNTENHKDRTRDKMAPGTVNVTSQNGDRSQGKVLLSLLPDDRTFKHVPRAPSIEKNKVKDRNLLRRQRRVSFESSPPQTLTGSDVSKSKKDTKCVGDHSKQLNDKSQNGIMKSNGTTDASGAVFSEASDSSSDPDQITREGTFTLSDSGEKSWNDDVMDHERSKSAASHCSTCTCGRQSPSSPRLKNRKVSSQNGDVSSQNGDVTATCRDVDNMSDISRIPSSTRPITRSAKMRIPKLTEEKRKVSSAKSRGTRHEEIETVRDLSPVGVPDNKKSVLKRINQPGAWEVIDSGLETRKPDNRLQPLRKKPETYALALNERRGLTLDAEPCPSCSEVHGKSSLQVDGEAERLPNPAELLLKIKRKHLRKRNLTDSVATYAKDCTPEGGAMTSRSEPPADKSTNLKNGRHPHRRSVTDAAHLEQLKEDVTLTLKRCTLTSANARMLAEDTAPVKTKPSAVVEAKSERLASIAQGQTTEEISLNKTYSLTNYDQFIEMAKIHKPESVPASHRLYKPLLNRRQVLALDFSKLDTENEAAPKTETDPGACDVTKDIGGEIGTLDTSMANTLNDAPKSNRLPPISPVSKKAPVRVKVKVTPRSRSKRHGKVKEYDIKSIKRVEDLPPLVREELKNKARLRLKQLSSPIQAKDAERDH